MGWDRGGRVLIKELHDSHAGRACNDCNGSTICLYHEQKTSASQWCFEDTYSIHHGYIFSTCHERKPRLHDGTVTEDTNKYWLVRIPPSGREPPVYLCSCTLFPVMNTAASSKGARVLPGMQHLLGPIFWPNWALCPAGSVQVPWDSETPNQVWQLLRLSFWKYACAAYTLS